MKLRQLLDLLEAYSSEAEVQIVRDRGYPIAHALDGVVSLSEIEAYDHDADLADDQQEVVYLLLGERTGLGRRSTWDAEAANR